MAKRPKRKASPAKRGPKEEQRTVTDDPESVLDRLLLKKLPTKPSNGRGH